MKNVQQQRISKAVQNIASAKATKECDNAAIAKFCLEIIRLRKCCFEVRC